MNGGRKEYRQSAEKLLRKAYKNSNRKRGLVLALTSGMLMLLGMLLLGFIQGKVRADQLRYLRENGSVVDTYVENGTEKTAEILKNFQMIRQIGLEKVCGKLMDNGIVYCECSVMEEQDWEKLKAAAYTDIYGAYPEEANEIMLSQKTLEFLGIRQPEIGMELSLEFHWNSVFIVKGTGRQNFILSGYYTDYRKDASNFSTAYLSKKKLEQADLTEFPCRILLDMKDSLRSGEQTEMLLRESIALGEDEYFVSEDSAFYKSVRGIAGSFGIGAFLLILLVLCAVLLIYQLIRISFLRDVRQYGIMRTIGVTVKQIRRVVYRQVLWDIFKGTVLGGILSCLIIGCVFPAMMTKMYMGEAGEMENASFLSVPFCAGYALVVCMIGFVTASRSFHVLFRANAAETMGLMETKRMSKKKKRFSLPRRKRPEDLWKKRKSFLMEMAWKSIGNSRRSFAFSILIVSLGGIAALCTVSLTNGTDLIRKLEKNPEFRIGITYNCYDFLCRRESDLLEMDFFPEDLRKQLENNAVCKVCGAALEAAGRSDDVSQDTLCSQREALDACKRLLSGTSYNTLLDAVADTRREVQARTAWRIEGTLREFPRFMPVNLWFEFPLHRPDHSGLLADIRPGEDAPAWKQGRDKKPVDKRQERLSALETAYDACNMGDGVTIADLMAYMGKTKNTVRSYIDEHPDFERDGGTVRRISQQEQPACAPF